MLSVGAGRSRTTAPTLGSHEIYGQFLMTTRSKELPRAVEEVFQLLKQGMDWINVGTVRDPDVCGGCQQPLFIDHHELITVCPMTNKFLHKSCEAMHLENHVCGALCRGYRRRESQREKQKRECNEVASG